MDRLLPTVLTLALVVVSFCATLGISSAETNGLHQQMDSLSLEIVKLRSEIEKTKEIDNSRQDTLVVDVRVNPQTIKIYNKCTN